MLGARTPVTADADLARHRVHVEHGGRVVCDVDAREATGHAPAVLSHLARLLAPYGHFLAAGDIVILGSMNPLTLAEAGKTFAVSIDGLGATSLSLTA